MRVSIYINIYENVFTQHRIEDETRKYQNETTHLIDYLEKFAQHIVES